MSRYKRKTKDIKGSLPHSQHSADSHVPKPQQAHPNRDEPGQQVHDEADLIQFRSDALNRFIKNQEYMEKVTSVAISCLKITPPSIFPVPTPRPAKGEINDQQQQQQSQASVIPGGFTPHQITHSTLAQELVRSEQIYFGDLEWMKQESSRMLKEMTQFIESLKEVKVVLHEGYEYQKEASNRLYKLHQELAANRDSQSYTQLQLEVDKVMREYKERFTSSKLNELQGFKKFSVKIDDVVVNEAPANYNPKLVNTYINFYANPGDQGLEMNSGVGDPNGGGNRSQGQFFNMNGGPIGDGAGTGVGFSPGGGGDHNGPNGPFISDNRSGGGNGGIFAGTPNSMGSMQRSQIGGPGGNTGRLQEIPITSQITPISGGPGGVNVDSHPLNGDSLPATNGIKGSEPSSISAAFPGELDEENNAKHLDNDLPTVYDNMIQDDINNLFDADNGLDLGNDGVNDLINFEDEDNNIMNDDAFDQDFLSQIDHSME